MARYIDIDRQINASDLIEWIMETYPDWCEGRIRSIVDHIGEMPTLSPDDVRGVGKWMPHPNPQFIEVDVCSVCGLGTRKMHHCTDGVQTWDEKTFFRYCPWCGAKLQEPPKGLE